MKLNNKIALITGGSRGLGRNAAIRLAENGADVILTFHRQKEAAAAVVADIENRYQRTALALQLDVGNLDALDDFFGRVANALKAKWDADRFDFLVNNAGAAGRMPIDQMTEALLPSCVPMTPAG